MRRSLLPVLALLPVVYAFTADATSRREAPRGEVVVRDCYGPLDDLEGGLAPAYGAPAKQKRGANQPKRKRPVAPAAPAPMTEDAMSAEPSGDLLGLLSAGGASASEELFMEEAEEAMPPAPEEPAPQAGADEAPRARARGPVMDWGAEVFLSNDDSMSLASAQRLLYAVVNHVAFSPREIRPHELLNYFSFDTATPSADKMFDVLASAERDGEKLSVALAVKGATPPRQPLDLTLIVDRSCSMEDEGRMGYTKRGLHRMEEELESGDRVDLVLFDDTKCVPLESFVVGRDDPKLLTEAIDRMEPLGGTDLDLGLREGYRVAQSHLDTQGRNRRVMLMTDAMLNTGDVNVNTVSEIGEAFEEDGVRLTGVGVGRDFNDEVLDKLTEKGKGAYVYLGSEAVVDRVFGVGFPSLTQTIAHDVQFSLQLPDSLAMERFYGEEASTVASDIQPINYYAGTSQVFLQDLVIKDGDPRREDKVTLTMRYRDALTGEPERRVFQTTVGKMLDADPHNVRKGLALMAWTDLLMEQAMGGDPCGAPLQAYAERAGRVSEDAEVAYLNGLVQEQCGALDLSAPTHNTVVYKVRVDSDIPIAEVSLTCGDQAWSESLSGADTVAMFEANPGACTVTLMGSVGMTAQVEVPKTGGDLRCIVRGGRLSCS